ncbi:hypothetical protein RJ639_035586 [Escallonia herrerae]|uniref:non-specific serine/threonine protein kinase n=1 Tax=Escallonia herrerae TaxID=1293975 RepID=A0AA88WNZ5_9ASTE|nr:hypothetical protein RJ639_035586 [Escallonia herrerae]
MVVRKVGKYEVGRTIGEGTFAKVKFAQNTETGESVAMKVLDRTTIIKHKMVDQIKREISIMKLVRHPNVVRLHEAWTQSLEYKLLFSKVLASRTKIYIILEFITGGELFDKIVSFSARYISCLFFCFFFHYLVRSYIYIQVHHGRLSEAESRRYFQQLIDGVGYCHSKGVYHRDLKPENLLLDSQENLKISDFGLSALPGEGISLLRTTCGTPNYVAPEVLSHKGYDGALADVWSCGVILYVLMAGVLPFDEMDLTTLYSKAWLLSMCILYVLGTNCELSVMQKIERAEFSCPSWFPVGAKSLIQRILDPNPESRIRIEDIRNDEWFKRGYVPVRLLEYEDVNLDDVNAVFDDPEEERADEQCRDEDAGPLILNAFDLITLSQGLNLSAMFDRGQDSVKHQTRFVSTKPAKVVLSSMEVVAQSMGFKTHIRNYKVRPVELCCFELSKTRNLSTFMLGLLPSLISIQLDWLIFQVAPTFIMVDIQKAAGDAGEYLKIPVFERLSMLQFYKNFCNNLEDIIWRPPTEPAKSRITKTKSKRR